MDHRKKEYQQFRRVFEKDLLNIASIEEKLSSPSERNVAVNAECHAAYERLIATDYGSILKGDCDLTRHHSNLESGLWKMSGEMRRKSTMGTLNSAILWVEKCPDERQFKFFGRIASIFDNFRDDPRFLDTEAEKMERESLCQAAGAYVERLDSLLGHVTVDLLYDQRLVRQIRKSADGARKLQRELAESPVLGGPGQSIFHFGFPIIVRQFSHAVGRLAFQTFGWYTPKVLRPMLEMKSSTAEKFGLPRWLPVNGGNNESTDREIRRYCRETLESARRAAKNEGWITREMIQFFVDNRALFTQDDGLPD